MYYEIYSTFSSSTHVAHKLVHFFLEKSPSKCHRRIKYFPFVHPLSLFSNSLFPVNPVSTSPYSHTVIISPSGVALSSFSIHLRKVSFSSFGQLAWRSFGQLAWRSFGQLAWRSFGQLAWRSFGQLAWRSFGQLAWRSFGQLAWRSFGQLAWRSFGQLAWRSFGQLAWRSFGQLAWRSFGQLAWRSFGQLAWRSRAHISSIPSLMLRCPILFTLVMLSFTFWDSIILTPYYIHTYRFMN